MATKLNLVIDQGADFTTSVNLNDTDGNPINLSTYTSRAQLRKHYTSSNAVNFSTSGTSGGVLTLSLTADQTANIISGRYVYDVEVVDSSNVVSRIVEGVVTVTPNVTR